MNKQLLAIDDISTILTVISSIFNDQFTVIKKKNGKEALEWIYQGNYPEVIICDLQMPEMNGFEFIQEIKSSGLLKHIPILVLSGQNTSAERVKCFRMGASEYISKPFNPEELKIRTMNLVERSTISLS